MTRDEVAALLRNHAVRTVRTRDDVRAGDAKPWSTKEATESLDLCEHRYQFVFERAIATCRQRDELAAALRRMLRCYIGYRLPSGCDCGCDENARAVLAKLEA